MKGKPSMLMPVRPPGDSPQREANRRKPSVYRVESPRDRSLIAAKTDAPANPITTNKIQSKAEEPSSPVVSGTIAAVSAS